MVNAQCYMMNVKIIHHSSLITHHSTLITYVSDRPGHDRRYAIDASKISRQLNWQPQETFESGIRKTVQSGAYR